MYGEDIFLINAVMDFIIIIICKMILKSKKKIWQQILAACFGGIYTILYYFYSFNWIIGKLLVPAIIVFIAFGFGNILEFLKKYVTFYIITYALGGAIYGFISLFGVAGYGFPVKTFIFAVEFTFVSVLAVSVVLEKRKKIEKNITQLKICHAGGQAIIPCLQDTGNESGNIIVELGALKKLLPSEFCLDIAQSENIIDIFEKWHEKLKLKIVPFNSIGTLGGMYLAFLADNVEIFDRNAPQVIGIFCGKLTPTGMYSAIA